MATVIMQVGEGVKALVEGDWVVPATTHMGSWQSLAVWKEADLLKLPAETLPSEHAAVFRELCLAYRLLEDHGNLKVCFYSICITDCYTVKKYRASDLRVKAMVQILRCLSPYPAAWYCSAVSLSGREYCT